MTPRSNEPQRLAALAFLELLDTPQEPAYDDLARLAAALCEAPMAFVSLLDETRQWNKAAWGAQPGGSAPRSLSLCELSLAEPRRVAVVPDTLIDPRVFESPLSLDYRFYAGRALLSHDGLPLGVLWVASPEPREMSDYQREALDALARQASDQLELRRQLKIAAEANARLFQTRRLLEQTSVVDELTGVKNQRCLQETLEAEFRRARRHGHALSCVAVELDGFEALRSEQGESLATHAQVWTAEALAANARSSDLIARVDPGRFTLVLPHTDAEGAWALAEKLRFEINKRGLPCSISLGAASLGPLDSTPAELAMAAEDALERALSSGGDRVAQRRR